MNLNNSDEVKQCSKQCQRYPFIGSEVRVVSIVGDFILMAVK